MPYDAIRKSLELTGTQWQALETLAERLQALAPSGPSVGDPSWRTLIKLIADGVASEEEPHKPAQGSPDSEWSKYFAQSAVVKASQLRAKAESAAPRSRGGLLAAAARAEQTAARWLDSLTPASQLRIINDNLEMLRQVAHLAPPHLYDGILASIADAANVLYAATQEDEP